MIVYILLLCVMLYYIYNYDAQYYRMNLKNGTACDVSGQSAIPKVFDNTKKRREHILVALLILVVGLRYHIGSDTVVYEWNFNTVETPYLAVFFRDWQEYSQPLWTFVMSFCKTVFKSFVAVQFFHAIVYNCLVYRFVRKLTPYYFTVMLLSYGMIWFANSFEVLRESISAGLFLNALLCLNEKKYTKYIIFGIVAMGFHRFAILIYALAPIVLKLNYKILATIFCICFIGVRFVDTTLINGILLFFSGTLDEGTRNQMLIYLAEQDSTVVSILGLMRVVVLELALPIFVLMKTSSKYDFYKKFVILWMIFSSMTSKVPILYRMNNYLTIIYIILFVQLIYSNHSDIKRHRILLVVLYFGTLVMSFWDIYRPSPMETRPEISYDCRYFPYKTIFEEPDRIREGLQYYH